MHAKTFSGWCFGGSRSGCWGHSSVVWIVVVPCQKRTLWVRFVHSAFLSHNSFASFADEPRLLLIAFSILYFFPLLAHPLLLLCLELLHDLTLGLDRPVTHPLFVELGIFAFRRYFWREGAIFHLLLDLFVFHLDGQLVLSHVLSEAVVLHSLHGLSVYPGKISLVLSICFVLDSTYSVLIRVFQLVLIKPKPMCLILRILWLHHLVKQIFIHLLFVAHWTHRTHPSQVIVRVLAWNPILR